MATNEKDYIEEYGYPVDNMSKEQIHDTYGQVKDKIGRAHV